MLAQAGQADFAATQQKYISPDQNVTESGPQGPTAVKAHRELSELVKYSGAPERAPEAVSI